MSKAIHDPRYRLYKSIRSTGESTTLEILVVVVVVVVQDSSVVGPMEVWIPCDQGEKEALGGTHIRPEKRAIYAQRVTTRVGEDTMLFWGGLTSTTSVRPRIESINIVLIGLGPQA